MKKICLLICFIIIFYTFCFCQSDLTELTGSDVIINNLLIADENIAIDYLREVHQLSEVQAESFMHFIRTYGTPTSYLDLQSIPLLSKNKAIRLFEVFNTAENALKGYSEKSTLLYLRNDSWDNNLSNEMKYRLKISQRDKDKRLSILLEKDRGEKGITMRYPYFSDHFTASIIKQLDNTYMYFGAFEFGMGQGLCLYQPLNFGLGSSFVQSEQEANKLRIKTNFDEDRFLNGIGFQKKGRVFSPVFALSTRLMDAKPTIVNSWPTVRTGGLHSSELDLSSQNQLHQIDALISTEINIGQKVQLFPSILQSNRRIWSVPHSTYSSRNWISLAFSGNAASFSYFGELASLLSEKKSAGLIIGLKYNIARKSGLSFCLKKSHESFVGLQARDFSNSVRSGFLHTQVLLDINLRKSRMFYLKYETRAKQLTYRDKFSLSYEKVKRKQWTFRSQVLGATEEGRHLYGKLKLYFGTHKVHANEYRLRLQIAQGLLEQWNPSVLLATDLIIKSKSGRLNAKTRIAFCFKNNDTAAIFAYENAPSGQYAIYNYNRTGLRFTQNLRLKIRQTTLEVKIHQWFPISSKGNFPIELQLKRMIKEE